jgi:hypothetical protein
MKVLALSLLFVVMIGLPAFALEQAVPAAAPTVVTMGEIFTGLKDGSIWKGILSGCLAGVAAALMGWFKNRNMATGIQERFEVKYMIPTVLVGALVGIVAALLKKAPADFVSSIEGAAIFGPITMGVESILKAVWRHGTLQLKDMLNDIKTGAGNPTPPAPPKG